METVGLCVCFCLLFLVRIPGLKFSSSWWRLLRGDLVICNIGRIP